MDKISQADAKALLKQAAATIRNLLDERDDYRTKLAARDTDDRIRKIAQEMETKSLNPDMTFEEKVASLREAGDLDVAEQAVKMASPQGFGLGGMGDIPSGGDSASALNTFIMTGEAPE